jgi:hypothetical protein
MAHGVDELSGRVEALARELTEVRARLARLEERSAAPATTTEPEKAGPTADLDLGPAMALPPNAIGLTGRALLALGGGYLLRAGTDGGVLHPAVGMLAGLAYAGFWLFRCERAARAGTRLKAGFHGFAALLIAFPLVVESTLRFRLLEASTAAALIVLAFAFGLGVATRVGLGALAWGTTLAAAASSLLLQLATRDLLPLAWATMAIATGAELLASRGRWLALRWPAALAVNAAVTLTLGMASRSAGLPPGYAPIPPVAAAFLGLALATLYVASTAERTLRRGRSMTAFEILETFGALAIGAAGAAGALTAARLGTGVVGGYLLLLGIACYLTAFGVVDRRAGQARNFYAYTTFGGLLCLAGSRLVGAGPALVAAWSLLAVSGAWLGRRHDRMTLRFHSVLFALAAAVASGLLRAAADGLAGAARVPWREVTASSVIALVGLALGYLLLARREPRDRPLGRVVPELLNLALLGCVMAGMGARLLGGLLASAPGPAAQADLLAAVRTAILTAVAVGLAWAGRRFTLAELSALAYPVMLVGGLKLLAEDFRVGRPLTLFLALALYGGALALVPRLSGGEE